MTNEEAREIFLNRGFVNGLFDGDKWRQSIAVISKWLEQQLCEDCISRKDLIEYANNLKDGIGITANDIARFPSIQPKLKTGHWVEEKINGGRKVFCSECGCPPPFEYVSNGDVYSASGFGVINKTKFCPNCGAKMLPTDSEKE